MQQRSKANLPRKTVRVLHIYSYLATEQSGNGQSYEIYFNSK
jgi:hypothetical protein